MTPDEFVVAYTATLRRRGVEPALEFLELLKVNVLPALADESDLERLADQHIEWMSAAARLARTRMRLIPVLIIGVVVFAAGLLLHVFLMQQIAEIAARRSFDPNERPGLMGDPPDVMGAYVILFGLYAIGIAAPHVIPRARLFAFRPRSAPARAGSLPERVFAAAAVALFAAAVVPLLILQAVALLGWGVWWFLAFCAAAPLAAVALIAAHELGHALVGRAAGLPFQRLAAGPLTVVYEGGRLRGRLWAAWPIPSGYVLFSGTGRSRAGTAAMVAAGPLVNLLIAAACLFAAGLLNPPPAPTAFLADAWPPVELALLAPRSLATTALNLCGLLSFFYGAGTLIPGRRGVMPTDGAQLVDLVRSSSS
jgi:Peptidase family M50